MLDYLAYKSVPIGSLVGRPPEEEQKYLAFLGDEIPPVLSQLIMSAKTGAYIRGLCRSYDLPADTAPKLSFAILRIVFAEQKLAQLPALLSGELRISNDKAQKMSQEIEHDLFAPVAVELSQYLARRKQEQAGSAMVAARQAGATNVLDLKQQPKRPTPPPIRR